MKKYRVYFYSIDEDDITTVEISYFLKSYQKPHNDLFLKETIFEEFLPEKICELTNKNGYNIEWILITKSCQNCG